MESRQCPACRADVPANEAACSGCGVPAPSSSDAAGAKRRWPVWAWVLVGVGCGCPAAIVLLGLLATLFVPNVMEKFDARGGSWRKARVDITSLVNALNEFAIRNAGQYPDSLEVLVIPDENGYRYLQTQRIPRDPWNGEYHYEPPPADASALGPHVWSHGMDGRPGTADDIDSRTMHDD